MGNGKGGKGEKKGVGKDKDMEWKRRNENASEGRKKGVGE